jgi:hypothetical protein
MHLPPMFLRRSGISPPPFAAASWRWSPGGLAPDAISAIAGLEVSISAPSGHLPNPVHKVRVGSLHNPVQTVSAGRLPSSPAPLRPPCKRRCLPWSPTLAACQATLLVISTGL